MEPKKDTKDIFLKTASRLFRHQGYHATGMNQIIKESKKPKGSLYHFFPNGKEELAIEAVLMTRKSSSEHLKKTIEPYQCPVEAIQALFRHFEKELDIDYIKEGGPAPIGLLTLETASMSQELRSVCRDTYYEWQSILEQKFIKCGLSKKVAAEKSVTTIVLMEGAVTLSIANQSTEPFSIVSKQLFHLFNN
ncbi:TetR/AcrR family transcriptional regulator [Halalkalibacter sp. APA_J-10(15)]|uniref:TetR/AcrR family transcriptional regulator n=1 Tax=Halalkalibacter sp. APA_J-10(15) TaxID=2933805 RepID=UPI001FF5BAE8|nr:TetR/AcrR family transcriptional regulator [Halalkalibacter sp. APA_J-10(15)]MCK0473126.1 TetR/AcrR family transcriptional regulator [Halalkalibacter sp. APA_J-10(15)]